MSRTVMLRSTALAVVIGLVVLAGLPALAGGTQGPRSPRTEQASFAAAWDAIWSRVAQWLERGLPRLGGVATKEGPYIEPDGLASYCGETHSTGGCD